MEALIKASLSLTKVEKDNNGLAKLFVIRLVEMKHLSNAFLNAYPKYNRIIGMLKKEGMLLKDGTLNRGNSTLIRYINLLSKKVTSNIADDYIRLWRGLRSITNTGSTYLMSSTKINVQKELEKFNKNHPEIRNEEILKATKYYLENAERQGNYYKYAPKSSTFINGNDKNSYLIDYCYIVKKDIVNKENSMYDGESYFIDG